MCFVLCLDLVRGFVFAGGSVGLSHTIARQTWTHFEQRNRRTKQNKLTLIHAFLDTNILAVYIWLNLEYQTPKSSRVSLTTQQATATLTLRPLQLRYSLPVCRAGPPWTACWGWRSGSRGRCGCPASPVPMPTTSWQRRTRRVRQVEEGATQRRDQCRLEHAAALTGLPPPVHSLSPWTRTHTGTHSSDTYNHTHGPLAW